MSRPAIITACMGGYDRLRAQVAQDIPVDWICVTDDDRPVPAPWRAVRVTPADPCSRMSAKAYKLQPCDRPDAIWIDANMRVTSPSFARRALAARVNGLAVWRHPDRDCIYDEAEASLRLLPEKYAGQPIRAQVDHYRSEGHPAHAGLYACGTLAWDWSDPTAEAIGRAWMEECRRWSYQDQLSLPVVLRRFGVVPGIFPATQTERRGPGWVGNRWLRIYPHLSAA